MIKLPTTKDAKKEKVEQAKLHNYATGIQF